MLRYICSNCGYIFDEEKGDIEQGISPGTKFEELDDNWKCPICYVSKDFFDKLD
ncbi:MAG: rubredoxin [Nitrospinae bacterium]|nr:rubredoxin [Nitrospinota bacterium]